MKSYARSLRLLASDQKRGRIRNPLIAVSGAILRESYARELKMRPTVLEPQHEKKLSTPMLCYTNFESERLGRWEAD